jgi:hypothetical protein
MENRIRPRDIEMRRMLKTDLSEAYREKSNWEPAVPRPWIKNSVFTTSNFRDLENSEDMRLTVVFKRVESPRVRKNPVARQKNKFP